MIKKKNLNDLRGLWRWRVCYVAQLCNDMCREFDVYLAYSLRPQTPKNYKEVLDERVHLIQVKKFWREYL